jgi:hypothetical protein
MTTPTAAVMATLKLNETHLISDVLRLHPQGEEVLRRHFGEKFLQPKSMKFLSMSMACILRGVNLTRLMEDLYKISPRKKGEVL